MCQGKGQRSHRAKNRRKHFHGKIGRAISNLVYVGLLVSDLWAMAGKNGTVFFTIDRHLECAIQTELVVVVVNSLFANASLHSGTKTAYWQVPSLYIKTQ